MIELFLIVLAAVCGAIWLCSAICTLVMTHELLGLWETARIHPMALIKYLAKGPIGAMDLWWVGQRMNAIQAADKEVMQRLADTKAAMIQPTHTLPHTYYN